LREEIVSDAYFTLNSDEFKEEGEKENNNTK
jgi:hypothetical protein